MIAICGHCEKEIFDKFVNLGYQLILCDDNKCEDTAVRNHIDLSLIQLNNNEFIAEKTQTKLIEILTNLGFNVQLSKKTVEGKYPNDVILNFALVGEYLIGNHKFADESLNDFCEKNNLKKIQTKQGYANCSCLVLSNKALITDDKSIYDSLKNLDIDALLISKGDVRLKNHDYGFIGGAGCKLDEKTVLFFGDITKHKDFEKIREFIKRQGLSFDYIENFELTDIGSAICI